jgi:BA14K-like protein
MKFFVYIAIVLVSIIGILLELDWLTKPKLETKSPMQTVSMAMSPGAKGNEGPNENRSPVYPKKTNEPRSVGSVTGTPQIGEPAGAANTPAVTESAAKSELRAQPEKPVVETTGAATPSGPSTVGGASVAALATTPPAPVASLATSNRCDVQTCAGAYQSFRVADCTYQPFGGGPRRICDRSPPGTGQKVAQPRQPQSEAAARRPNKDAELREEVRREKQIAGPAEADDQDDDDDVDADRGERVIVIERPVRRPW